MSDAVSGGTAEASATRRRERSTKCQYCLCDRGEEPFEQGVFKLKSLIDFGHCYFIATLTMKQVNARPTLQTLFCYNFCMVFRLVSCAFWKFAFYPQLDKGHR